jgi:hypothetical protein
LSARALAVEGLTVRFGLLSKVPWTFLLAPVEGLTDSPLATAGLAAFWGIANGTAVFGKFAITGGVMGLPKLAWKGVFILLVGTAFVEVITGMREVRAIGAMAGGLVLRRGSSRPKKLPP